MPMRGAGHPQGARGEVQGAEIFVIANSDGVMSRPNAVLMAEVFPGVELKPGACSATGRANWTAPRGVVITPLWTATGRAFGRRADANR
jgi:hypothetical protein